MSLRVHVRSASDLPGLNKLGGKSDPYCVLSFKRQKRQTEYILNELNPVWKKDFSWDLREPLDSSDVLKVKVLDYEKIGFAQFIGRLTVSLASLTVRKELSVHENLLSKQGKSIKGKIQLEVFYSPPACAEGKHHSKPGPYSTPDGLDNTVHDERRHEALRQKAEKQKLPKKPIDFQVRVHIMEARKLPGELLRSMVRVVCGRETRETTVKKGTANPHWSERFFFNMKELPDVVMDTLLEIKVFNVKMLMKDALIGSFKLDLGVVYDEPEHCFVHKWLLLTHPDDPSGKSKGYLKCSIVMIGPGDDPVSPYSKMANEDTDIESNLLRPAGAQLQPATLTIRLLKAEDLPQMDQDYFNRIKKTFFPSASKKQNLVDPYCSVLYAGHTGETDVVYNCQDPIWNQQIKLGVRFPLLSDRIRFTVKDRDQLTRDDIIGTFFLNMSHISAPGEDGFLPTFGPCFVNVYGSPREYSDAPDAYESINKGLYEGVAYRGRVMAEVEMQLGQLPENSLEDVSDADLRRAVRTMSVKPLQYTLHGAFLSATMVKPSDAVVEFEVSIGDKGYLVNGEGDGTDVTSLTPPMKPVYDGHMYHYLPWLETKPCVLVESQWQDCQYRLDTLNYLLHAANHLEHGLGEVRRRLQRKCCYEEDLKGALLSAIALFEDDLGGLMEWTSKKTPLPKMYTRLDACLKESRHRKLKHMYKELMHLKEHHLLSSSQKHSKMSCEAMADECEDYLMELKNLAVEPQNCIPDVILWMLSDGKRVAYHRIPSHLLVFSEDVRFKGSKCGRIQTIILGPAGQEKLIGEEFDSKCGAQLRLMLWLGRKDVGVGGAKDGWTAGLLDTEESVYAETYENQQNFLGKWGGSFLTVPLWSDVTGRVNQPRDAFHPPPGWKWAHHQDWKISTGCSDALLHLVHSEWKDEVYEHQDRRPLAPWPSTSYWISLSGEILRTASSSSRDQDRLLTGEDLQGQLSLLPQGWEWKDKQWTIDSEKPTDSEGWEYTMKIGSRYGSWLSYEKKTDLSRRRRWVRKRRRVDDPSPLLGVKVQQKALCTSEGWLYGSSRSGPFHPQERVFDMFRRRCWLRKMVSTGNTRSPPVFEFVHGVRLAQDQRQLHNNLLKQGFPQREWYVCILSLCFMLLPCGLAQRMSNYVL